MSRPAATDTERASRWLTRAVSTCGLVSALGCGDSEPATCTVVARDPRPSAGGGSGIGGVTPGGTGGPLEAGRSSGGAVANSAASAGEGGYRSEPGGARNGGATAALGGSIGVGGTIEAEAGHAGAAGSAPGCGFGMGDCDGLTSTGCETELLNSGSHCGACHHDCEGAACVDGKCQPQQLEVIGAERSGLAVGGGYVYWSTEPQPAAGVTSGLGPAEIHRCTTNGRGTQSTVFASGFSLSLSLRLSALAVAADGRDVYWMVGHVWDPVGNLVLSCPAAGCPVAGPTAMDAGGESFFALTSTHLVWRDVGTTSIKAWPRSGGAASFVASEQEKGILVVADEEDVLWDQNQTIYRCPIGTDCGVFGAVKLVAGSVGSSHIYQMALLGGELYWSTLLPDGTAILSCNKRKCIRPTIVRGALGARSAPSFHAQEKRLFVATYPTADALGELSVCELPFCATPRTLVTYAKPISQLTADGKRLFWISEQSVMKLVLPE